MPVTFDTSWLCDGQNQLTVHQNGTRSPCCFCEKSIMNVRQKPKGDTHKRMQKGDARKGTNAEQRRCKSETHWSLVPQILLSPLFKNGSKTSLFPVITDFAWQPWLFKNNGECLGNRICQFPHPWDVCHQVTRGCSASSSDPESTLCLEWKGFYSLHIHTESGTWSCVLGDISTNSANSHVEPGTIHVTHCPSSNRQLSYDVCRFK